MKFRIIVTAFLLLCIPAYALKLGYALSGGGARGFAHIGVLKVLEEEGIRPDIISGTSVGAVIGAFYSMGYSAAEIESIAVAVNWQEIFAKDLSRKDLYIGQKRWAPYGNLKFELSDNWMPQLPRSVYRINELNLKLFEIYAPAASMDSFALLPIPFSSVATDLFSGKEMVFTEGDLMQAVRASMTVPSLFLPFEVNGSYYIDGGILQNLPTDALKQMGADLILGIKTNSSLKDEENLGHLIDVLDQTINIAMTRNLSEHQKHCDLVFEPDLAAYPSTDFSQIRQVIDLGEAYARSQLDSIRKFKAEHALETKIVKPIKIPQSYFVSEIAVKGNENLSPFKIREYTHLDAGRSYTVKELSAACRKAYNSELFQSIYPILEAVDEDSFRLILKIQENANKILALNFAYNTDVKLAASSVLRLNNVVLRNSSLLAELKLGGVNEFNLDYVKNFGELWGIYYRIFPFINESTMYAYDDSHQRTHSVKSLERGFTSGLGLFGPRQAAVEFFMYNSHRRLYRGIAESPLPPRSYQVGGFGFKAMHESLDDYVFPTQGARVITKFNFARDELLSDYVYSLFSGKIETYLPFSAHVSGKFAVDIGSFFNSAPADKFDPYPLGGAEGFMAYPKYELSAPHYRILELALKLRPYKQFFFTLGAQHLSYAENELWGSDYLEDTCLYGSLGLKSAYVPLRLGVAISTQGRVNSMLNIGYDFDIFAYSRK